jgi:acetoin utilization protein AcuC
MTAYDFGPQHPLKPVRLERTVALLKACVPGFQCIDPGPGSVKDALRVHSLEYVEVVRALSDDATFMCREEMWPWGFGTADDPVFEGMFEASLAYVAGTVRAAEAVRDGAPLAFGIAGGLHHAQRSRASGFCVFNDPAIACSILRERFDRVAYVDIDLHHGDGVQALFFDDPTVMTCSIHETGRRLYPGTGFVEERGAGDACINVPLEPFTTGDVWLWAFENGIVPALRRFAPQAVVLQMGTDPHFLDPLGHLQVAAQEWVEAVKRVQSLGLPIVAAGGGGYELSCVPRMWSAAVMTLCGIAYDDAIPDSVPREWGMATFADHALPQPRNQGREAAESVVARLASGPRPSNPL